MHTVIPPFIQGGQVINMKKKLLIIGLLYLTVLFIMSILTFIMNSARLLAAYVFSTLLLIGFNLLEFRSYVQGLPDERVKAITIYIIFYIILSVLAYLRLTPDSGLFKHLSHL